MLDLSPLTTAQQTVINKYTGQPVADGTLHQSRRHRGIDPARQRAQRASLTDLRAHLLDECLGDIGCGPCRFDAGELMQKAAQHLLSMRRVQHLGVVLHPGQPSFPILERRHRGALAAGDDGKTLWCLGNRVAMAHPHRLHIGQAFMQVSAGDR